MLSSSHRQTLTIAYNPWKKLVALAALAIVLLLLWVGLHSNFFILEIALVLLGAYAISTIVDIVATRSISFYPEQIVKTSHFGQTVIPTGALIITEHAKEQVSQFSHSTNNNSRESIKVYGWFLSLEVRLWLDNYCRNVYRTGDITRKPISAKVPELEFNKALWSFRFLALLTVVYLLFYVLLATFLHGRYQLFAGYAADLPIEPVRLLFIATALGGYLLLKQMNSSSPPIPSNQSVKIQHLRKQAFRSALVANGVAWLGLPLFLLSGNKLDFYLLLLIGIVYYYDFYPRLSDYERLLLTGAPAAQRANANVPRRSLQVSLVLLGGLSLVNYSGNPAEFKIRQQNCPNDNGNTSACQSGFGSSGFNSFGSSDNRNPIRRGGFGSFGGSHFSFGS